MDHNNTIKKSTQQRRPAQMETAFPLGACLIICLHELCRAPNSSLA
jgi:hypothetical protein